MSVLDLARLGRRWTGCARSIPLALAFASCEPIVEFDARDKDRDTLSPGAGPSLAVGSEALPAGFTSTVVTSIHLPMAMAFAPDGRIFVTEIEGNIRIIKNGVPKAEAFTWIRVDRYSERGLMGIALDPNFASNRYLYVYYTRATAPIKNRVSRFRASLTNPDVAEPGSEKVLLDDIPSESGQHNGGALVFGRDGKLYIGVGDSGTNTVQAQNLGNLAGKILRINPDGTIPGDNPFVGQAGARGEVWTYGMRNPFTLSVHPLDGKMYANDVGETSWEEIDEIRKGGNYGWPSCEGVCNDPRFVDPVHAYPSRVNLGACVIGGVFYEYDQFPAQYRGKYFFADYAHNEIRYLDENKQSHLFATGTSYLVHLNVGPDGSLYYLSLAGRALVRISYGSGGPPPPPTDTTTPPPADTTTPPSGSSVIKVYAAGIQANGAFPNMSLLIDDKVVQSYVGVRGDPHKRIFQEFSFTAAKSVLPGQVKVSFTNDSGLRDLVVDRISINGTTYESEAASTLSTGSWNSATACEPGYKKTEWLACSGYFLYAGPPPGGGTPSNTPPVPEIVAPLANSLYSGGESISYSGGATDAQDGTLAASRLSWKIVFHHETHWHPFLGPIDAVSGGSFTIPTVGEKAADVWYRIHLTATDASGVSDSTYRDIVPRTANITVASDPTGLQVEVDGQPKTAPYTVLGVQRVVRGLSAAATQSKDGKQYEFVSWSDGGAREHSISTPASPTTYTARYRQVVDTLPPTPPSGGTVIKIYAAGVAVGGVYPSMDLLIDNVQVANFWKVGGNPSNRNFQEFTFTTTKAVQPQQVRIAFTNDSGNRDLMVDRITINGKAYESEAPSTFSRGAWTPSTGCDAGHKASEWLNCNGYFQYAP